MPRVRQGRSRAATVALIVLAAVIFGSWAVLAADHVHDRFALDHVAGTRMALAQYANQGNLYPPLYENGFYGGSRFMPIPILLHAGLARLTGEYLVSGKVVSYLSMALLLAVTFLVLRSFAVPVPLSLGLTGAVLVTQPGILAGTSISGDALPVALQLLAVLLVARSSRRWVLLGAAALCVLALFAKLSAVWAPIAIALWLGKRDRRGRLVFGGAFLGIFAVTLLAFVFVTHGRLITNVVGLSFSGESGLGSILRPFALPRLLVARTGAISLLFGLGLIGGLWAFADRHLTIYTIAFACALVVLAVVLTDVGADYNHLLDVLVLGMILVGELWSRLGEKTRIGGSLARAAIALAVLAATATTFVATMARPVEASMKSIAHGTDDARYERDPVRGYIDPGQSILSEDPYIPMELRQRPVILDAFMLLRMQASHPQWIRNLTDRISRREFDAVVLLKRLDSSEDWYTTWHFGSDVWRALLDHYRLTARSNGYFVYSPIP